MSSPLVDSLVAVVISLGGALAAYLRAAAAERNAKAHADAISKSNTAPKL